MSPQQFDTVTHVIFDLDGLLLDTEPLYTKANETVLATYDRKFSWEVKQKQMGRGRVEAIETLLREVQLDIPVDEYRIPYEKLLDELFPTAPLMAGAERLIRHLHAHKVPMAICTGSPSDAYAQKTSRHDELFALFSHVVAASDDPLVRRGKPAPDCFEQCAARFASPPTAPGRALVFEDAVNGVAAAVAAGMPVVMVPDERVAAADRALATLSLAELSHFAPESFGLPPFTG